MDSVRAISEVSEVVLCEGTGHCAVGSMVRVMEKLPVSSELIWFLWQMVDW